MLDTKTNADLASTPVTISAFNYGVNNLGQRTGVSTSGSAFAGGYSLGWAYNASGELKEEDFGANQTSDTRDRAFQYDAIGNREKTANGLLAGLPATPNYAANGLNQYTVANGITLPTTPAPHDADGNAKAWNIRNPLAIGSSSLASCSFTWDAENRLTEVKDSGGNVIATYAYDFQSRRIRKTVASGEDVAFFYEGWNCVAEYQVGTTIPQTRYTWGQDLSGSMQGAGGVGGLLAVVRSSVTYYPTYDGNGNVSEYMKYVPDNPETTEVDEEEFVIVAHFEYDAFGNVVNFTESGAGLAATFRHRFSTKPQDTETGLLYYGYRYYDPVTGRWPSRDPIEERGGVNLYGFVGNEPISALDVLGLRESYKTRYGAADAGNRAAREASDKDLEERKSKKKPGEDIVMRPFEFGGRICCDIETKTFYLTGPGTSNEDELIKVQDMPPCDEGDTMVGYYHSHPHGGQFSTGDKSVAANGKKKDYPDEKHTNKQGDIDAPYQVPPNVIAGVMARHRGEWVSLIYIPGVGTFRRNPDGDVDTKEGWIKIN